MAGAAERMSFGRGRRVRHAGFGKKDWLRFGVVLAVLLAAGVFWIVISGFQVRGDVFVGEYAVLPSGDAMLVRAGVAGSMGYIRNVRVTEEDGRVVLRFYSAYGGLNSALGANNTFIVPLADDCTEIGIVRADGIRPVLHKDPESGEWKWVGAPTASDAPAS
jgi:hypothetical protein